MQMNNSRKTKILFIEELETKKFFEIEDFHDFFYQKHFHFLQLP